MESKKHKPMLSHLMRKGRSGKRDHPVHIYTASSPKAKEIPMDVINMTQEQIDALTTRLPCPACGCEFQGPLIHETVPTNTRSDDHYRRYDCADECGFRGEPAFLNSTWDEGEAQRQAQRNWNNGVVNALKARHDREQNPDD